MERNARADGDDEMLHTLSSVVRVARSFTVTITAASTNGAVVDTRGFTRALAIFDSAPSGTGTASDCKLQEGDQADGSDMADVTGAAFAQVTTSGGAKIQVMDIDLSKRKRYLRLVHTGSGGSAAGAATGMIALSRARRLAVTQDNAVISV